MKLTYKGEKPYDDGRFVAEEGDVVDFLDAEAEAVIRRDPELWTRPKPKPKKKAKEGEGS